MGTNDDIIRQRTMDREQVLAACYKLSNGRSDKGFLVDDVSGESGLDRDRVTHALEWHCGQGTACHRTLVMYGLTPEGVGLYEATVLSTPNDAAAYSPVIQQVFHGPVGAVQNGPFAVANVVQQVSHREELKQRLSQLEAAIVELRLPKQDEAIELVREIDAETQTETPSKVKLNAYVTMLMTMVTGVASNLLTEIAKNWLGLR
jgi:hypothetical protein